MSTTVNNSKSIIPQFRIETRVSFIAWEQGVEVPLGYDFDGEWVPYHFMEDAEGLVLTPKQLAMWLAGPNSFESPYIDNEEEAMSAVEETIQRCRELAETAERENRRANE